MIKHPPLELNEKNVLEIYNICLANESDLNSSDLLPTKIFTKEECGKDSPEIIFSKSRIKSNSQAITYLYGQLRFVHAEIDTLYAPSGFVDYTGNAWTQDNSTLMAFYYLGVANTTINPFSFEKGSKNLSTDLFLITPTLSPNDPNFKKKSGQEPADD